MVGLKRLLFLKGSGAVLGLGCMRVHIDTPESHLSITLDTRTGRALIFALFWNDCDGFYRQFTDCRSLFAIDGTTGIKMGRYRANGYWTGFGNHWRNSLVFFNEIMLARPRR